jgi:DNA mismatch endonuclease Vsr
MDVVDKAKRWAMMAGIRRKNTQPELRVRRIVHGLGYRYRLRRRDQPGMPDLVFPDYLRLFWCTDASGIDTLVAVLPIRLFLHRHTI